jgi:hypothetical protein
VIDLSRKEKYVAFREQERIIGLLDQVVADKGIDRSDFIREAVRRRLADLSFFTAEQKKSLGLSASFTGLRGKAKE